jgi:hypothetical protein
MAFQLSPGVNVSEIDLTTIVPAVSTSAAAIAGQFNWGPVNEVITIGNEIELVDRFGKPDANTFRTFFCAANFLGYGNNLKVVRAANTSVAKNASAGAESVFIANQDQYITEYYDQSANAAVGIFSARYAGDKGNSLSVSLAANTAGFTTWTSNNEFNTAPGTSNYAARLGGANDEMHIIVYDRSGKFTGISGTVLEKFAYVSKAFDAKNDDGS